MTVFLAEMGDKTQLATLLLCMLPATLMVSAFGLAVASLADRYSNVPIAFAAQEQAPKAVVVRPVPPDDGKLRRQLANALAEQGRWADARALDTFTHNHCSKIGGREALQRPLKFSHRRAHGADDYWFSYFRHRNLDSFVARWQA